MEHPRARSGSRMVLVLLVLLTLGLAIDIALPSAHWAGKTRGEARGKVDPAREVRPGDTIPPPATQPASAEGLRGLERQESSYADGCTAWRFSLDVNKVW